MMLKVLQKVGNAPTHQLHNAAVRVEHDPALHFDDHGRLKRWVKAS